MERRQKAKTAKKTTSKKPKKTTIRHPTTGSVGTTFVFYSKSADAKPGKGIHEHEFVICKSSKTGVKVALRCAPRRTMSDIGGLILFGVVVSLVGSAATAILYCVCVRMSLPLSRQEVN
jgi:hypothetical protein